MQQIVETVSRAVAAKLERFPWERRHAYIEWLGQTYYYVRHSTRLLAAAAARFNLDEQGNAFHVRFGAHLGEERSHEKLALRDLGQLGATIESIPEQNLTRMFYETQYYKIEHQSPFSLYGYILMLEASGPICGQSIMDRIGAAHGQKCTSFIGLHASEDVDHVQRALQMVGSLEGRTRSLVLQNLEQSAEAYGLMLSDIQVRTA